MANQFFKDKKILLGVPNHFGLPERFKENLEFLGFKVTYIKQDFTVKFIPFKDIIYHVYRKSFYNDRTHKTKIRNELKLKKQIKFWDRFNENFDYSLIIRPDLYPTNVIEKITEIAKLNCAYQWDGMNRYPLAKELFHFFDRFFVFDVNDLGIDKEILPTTNFYFDNFITIPTYKTDVFFVGTYFPDRIEIVSKIAEFFHENNLKTDINIITDNKTPILQEIPYVKISKQCFSFKENIQRLQESRIILDFANSVHNGLSFRTFESIGFKKKLITNNPLVKKYDFYHPNNIFVFENDCFDGLKEFLTSQYVDLEKEVYNKYSFTNWISYILNIEPHQILNLEK